MATPGEDLNEKKGLGWLLVTLFNLIRTDIKTTFLVLAIFYCGYQVHLNNKLRDEIVNIQPRIYERIITEIRPKINTIQETVNEAKSGVDTMREKVQQATENLPQHK